MNFFDSFFEFVSSLGNTPLIPPELVPFFMGLFKLSVAFSFAIVAVFSLLSFIYTSFKDFRK